jgi:hypothetical protein
MRRDDPAPSPQEALQACEDMLRSEEGLRLMLPLLPAGSTLEDARRFHLRQKQAGRRRSGCMLAFLDGPP